MTRKITMTFSDLGLCPRIIKALEEKSYKTPSPIQLKAIPLVAQGSDIIACAGTGTGKTAAFSLPLIERIVEKNDKWRNITVLVLSPTRELATQIVDNINSYTTYLPIRALAVYGGVKKEKQLKALNKGVQIVVATPGRLLDYIKQRSIDLSGVETLVLDEADRMLDMGFIRDVRQIMRSLPRGRRQTLLFSATISKEIKDLSRELLDNPKTIQVNQETKSKEKIEQVVHPVVSAQKKKLLAQILKAETCKQVIVFTRTKRGSNNISEFLNKNGLQARAFHSDKAQETRKRILESFKEKKVDLLVATDIAARGLDIKELPLVINYDLPEVPENYVHRIGRTGRAGHPGRAISFVSPDQRKYLVSIENLLRKKLPSKQVEGFDVPKEEPVKSAPAMNRDKKKKKKKYFRKSR